jgi:hypothetical protein
MKKYLVALLISFHTISYCNDSTHIDSIFKKTLVNYKRNELFVYSADIYKYDSSKKELKEKMELRNVLSGQNYIISIKNFKTFIYENNNFFEFRHIDSLVLIALEMKEVPSSPMDYITKVFSMNKLSYKKIYEDKKFIEFFILVPGIDEYTIRAKVDKMKGLVLSYEFYKKEQESSGVVINRYIFDYKYPSSKNIDFNISEFIEKIENKKVILNDKYKKYKVYYKN